MKVKDFTQANEQARLIAAAPEMLKETWRAGWNAAMDSIGESTPDIPEEYFFEKYMEQVLDELQKS